ncbi:MAG: thiamine-binding protein, partial [Methanothrix sp.]|nr:thiamine-binding protein [Methanothrix sp.]
MIVAEFTAIPMGSGTSASKYVEAVYELLKESGMKYMPGPMSTSVETDSFEMLFQILEKTNRKLANMGVQR